MKIAINKAYYVDGKIKKHTYNTKVKDLNKYFDNTIKDAEFFAKTRFSKVEIQRTENSLFIDYSDIPNTTHIDTAIITI